MSTDYKAQDSQRLRLDAVTVCCVDTRFPELALYAIRKTLAHTDFANILLFTDRDVDVSDLQGVSIVRIDPIRSKEEYSHFTVKRLVEYVKTDFVLIVQWDGFVVHPECWDQRFLEFDYLGAVWPNRDEHRSVGNGGFSLRSLKLLKALQDPRITDIRNEDDDICMRYRDLLEQEYGIRFAPIDLAQLFAFERRYCAEPSFGFHGFFNFGRVLTDAELSIYIDRYMPEALFASREALELAVGMLAAGQLQLVHRIMGRRIRLKPHDLNTLIVADRVFSNTEPCGCGSGRTYGGCCGARGAWLAARVMLRSLAVRLGWSSLK